MKVVGKFLLAELVWGAGIFVLLVVVGSVVGDPLSAPYLLRWLARALVLAAFPAGIAIAPDVFDSPQPWRQLINGAVAAALVGVVVFAIMGLVAPAVSTEIRSLPQLLELMNGESQSWETRNDAAWDFYTTLFDGLNAWLFAAIGVQAGIWARYALPRSLRRALHWTAGLGLLISGFGVFDTTYETIVLHTAADASFAAFYTVMIPASVCLGLALPTLALLRRAEITRYTS
jgi:hypothetical protein